MNNLRFTQDGEVIISRCEWDLLTALENLREQGSSLRLIAAVAVDLSGIEFSTRAVWRLIELRRRGIVVVGE